MVAENFKIEAYYPYASYVQNQLASFDEWEKRGDLAVKKLFAEIFKEAQKLYKEKYGKHLELDNKVAFKITFIETGSTFYVGYKDNKYTLGLTVWQEFNKIIEL